MGEFFHRIKKGKTPLENYYEGLKIYERLFSRKGLDGVLEVVQTFTSDEQLINYATT